MRADRFEDVELGAFERFYDERPFEGRSYPGPYFETEIASGMKRGLAVSVEGPTVDDARALMDQVRAIIARPLPTQEMYSALLETFPKAFPWNTPRQLSYAVTPSAICVGREGDYSVHFDVDSEDDTLVDYWPVVWLDRDGNILSAHADGGRGVYPGGRDYTLPESTEALVRSWPSKNIWAEDVATRLDKLDGLG